ncbi:ABC transporter permease [Herbiconiux sp. CPCC 203407]|uniref:ABC transporter permease n=1 Tax=Herbiconiux oxytropis TaxID=2970915 RepID=A0AA41XGK2_9MICO|nr:ABC transporter permease [Herbiconiux oxytropis]MCS5721449.1 ABC transporter permease [Herbiconiux oxytropis]MCS5724526.1 ABC transporter permease [Herbiconiux oxytropis]
MTKSLAAAGTPARPRAAAGRAAHPIRRLLLWRVPLGVLSVVLVGVLTYLATRVLPGDAASAILGQFATPEALASLREELGLDQPLVPGLLSWFGDFVTGQFGTSLATRGPVTDVVLPRLENSAVLILIVALVSTVIGVVGGVMAANRRDGIFDSSASLVALVASALPEFVVGVFVIFVFSVGFLDWFPAVSIIPPEDRIWDEPIKLVLPALTLVIVTAPYMFRMVRAAMIEALTSDYAEVARLKGASTARLLFRHALPNATAPAVQVLGLNLLYLAGGIVLVETVFQYPGIGLALASAVQTRDVPVLQFIVVLLAIFFVTLNILTDLLVLLSTPRRRAPR